MITRRGLLKGLLGGAALAVLAPVTSAIPSKPVHTLFIIDEVPPAHDEIYGRISIPAYQALVFEHMALYGSCAIYWPRNYRERFPVLVLP